MLNGAPINEKTKVDMIEGELTVEIKYDGG